jgi:hypothetical protein
MSALQAGSLLHGWYEAGQVSSAFRGPREPPDVDQQISYELLRIRKDTVRNE